MTTLADRLFVELDRQLAEVRTIADGLAARSGILVSANALAAGLLGTRFDELAQLPLTVVSLVLFGLGATFGFAAIAPSMYVGMSISRLTYWLGTIPNVPASDASDTPTGNSTLEFFTEKLIFVKRNHSLLHLARVFFYIQGVLVVAAVSAAFLALTSQIDFPLVVEGPLQ
ncbi:hypothetical protein [Pseudonocardia charpentierae]|uniref:Uncharacterized protein n=1 Tax=Pseudonocardia charpentierae TaxID=3075545 RepID=A0ABU2NGB3_9PSEU|nr:hypothetical protein [Pseudonocardia sp. DSM 45834]MDT0351654.1 hypothetical protein [Pseudonocardia sp. DSM 45834]